MSNTKNAKTVRFHEIGNADVLKIEDVSIPNPINDEVTIKVEAIGLNRAEVMFREGQYLVDPILPSRLGYEVSGIVEAIGPNVKSFKVGEKVSTVPAFSIGQYGVYGEIATVPEHESIFNIWKSVYFLKSYMVISTQKCCTLVVPLIFILL